MDLKIEIQQKIIQIFNQTNEPLSITDISKKVGIQRITAKKHLERLIEMNLIKEIKKPPLRLFVSNDKIKLENLLVECN